MTFGEWLRKKRVEKHLAGVQLERLSGVSRQVMAEGQVGAGRLILFPSPENNPVTPSAHPNLTAYQVCGASLETDDPRTSIFDGDTLICTKKFAPEDIWTRICIIRLHRSELVARRITRDGDKLILTPTNPAFGARTVEASEAEIIAVVIAFERKT